MAGNSCLKEKLADPLGLAEDVEECIGAREEINRRCNTDEIRVHSRNARMSIEEQERKNRSWKQ